MLRIQPDGWLVQNQELGRVERRSCDISEPAPSARELSGRLPSPGRKTGSMQGGTNRDSPSLSVESREPCGEQQVFLDREQPINTGLLKYETQAAADGGALAGDIMAEDAGPTAGRREQCRQ
jgi:hypothetical protein